MYEDIRENPYEDTGGKDTIALTGVKNIYFPDMRDWIKKHIELAVQNKVVTSKTEENMLLADVIQVLNLLVKYGYYDDPKDVEGVLIPLLDVLNGFTDLPYADVDSENIGMQNMLKDFTEKGRFMETTENKPVFDIKARFV